MNNKEYRFNIAGIDLNAPVDAMPEEFAPILENWRSEQDGSISVRPGQGAGTVAVVGQSPTHTIKRLNDNSSGTPTSVEIVGTGTHVASVSTDLTLVVDSDSGYSGNPLSISVLRPTESIKPYAYIADNLRYRKIDVNGNLKAIGLPPVTVPPLAVLDVPAYKVLNEFNDKNEWTGGGPAYLPASLADNLRIDNATRSVTKIQFDAAAFGWACVQPSSMQDIGAGMRITIDPAGTPETVNIQAVFRGSVATTIAGIQYESGTSGRCAIHFATPMLELAVDALLQDTTVAAPNDYARVLSVHITKDGLQSVVINTAVQWSAADNIKLVPSFRAYFALAHASGVALQAKAVEFRVVNTGTAGDVGYISRTVALDLSLIQAGTPTRPEDFMGLSIFADKPDLVKEVKVMVDIDVATNDFTRNFLQHVIRANDLTPVTKDTQTEIANRQLQIQRNLIDRTNRQQVPFASFGDTLIGTDATLFNPPIDPTIPVDAPTPDRSNQTEAAQNQYAEIKFRISELLLPDLGRIGADFSRGLQNVAAIRIQATVTGTVVFRVDGWWIGGGYGPDVAEEDRPFVYAIRPRDSSTGVVGNLSPAFRGGVRPLRQKVLLSTTQHPSADVDKIDWFRYGGIIQGWHYLGSSTNSATPLFTDTLSDLELTFRSSLDNGYNENYQLWPQRGLLKSGTGSGTGTLFVAASGSLPIVTAPGTAIRIDGKDYIIYRVFGAGPTGTMFELTESIGKVVTVAWEVPLPILLQSIVPTTGGAPVIRQIAGANDYFPILVGTFKGFTFGLGDQLNPGLLYITNGNNADTTRESYWKEVTPPGEPLQNIVIFEEEGRAILWSVSRTFVVEPAFTTDPSEFPFNVREVSSTQGLFARWACCAAGASAIFLGKDGLYSTQAGEAIVTTESLRTIFPHEGSLGVTTNGVFAPNVVAAQRANLRLSYADREVYFDYIDTNAAHRTLVLRRKSNANDAEGWRIYSYAAAAQVHYGEEGEGVHSIMLGGVDGKIYRLGRNSADAAGASITAAMRTPSLGIGDARISQYVGDEYLDYDTNGATITVYPGFNNHSVDDITTPTGANGTSGSSRVLNDAAGRTNIIMDLNAGQGVRARNCSLHIVTTVTTLRPILYLWDIRYSQRVETTNKRADDYSLRNGEGVKYVRGVWIYADTYGQNRQVTLEYTRDDGTVASLVIQNINHPVLTRRFYPINNIYMIAARLRPSDANKWDFQGYEFMADPAPPLSFASSPWMHPEGNEALGVRFVQGVTFDTDTAGTDVIVSVQGDEGASLASIQAGQNGGPVNCNGRGQKAFSFETPFLTHLIRVTPIGAWRLFNIKWDTRPEPEMAYMWRTQQTSCGMPNFKYFGDGYLGVRSTDNVIFTIIGDGIPHIVAFYDAVTNTGNARRRLRFRCPAFKAKSVEFELKAFTLAGRAAAYEHDFTLQVKEWGAETAWQDMNPLGNLHWDRGATI